MSRSQSTPQSSQMIWLESRIERLEAELANIKEIEFPKRVEKVAEGWRGKCETLEAENEQLSLYKQLADEYGLVVFADIADLNARIDDRDAALLHKSVALSECQKQRDELLKDAERYRWLRSDFESNIVVVTGLDTIDYGSSGVAATYEYALRLEELDTAIDAAIASVKEPK